MTNFLLRRVLQTIFVVWGALTITFIVVRLVPGDPAAMMLGPFSSSEDRVSLTQELGLDAPLLVQYGRYLVDAVNGDFGPSFRLGGEAMDAVIAAAPGTILLAVTGMLLTLALSFPMGVAAARRPGGWVDRIVSFASLLGQSLPPFWVGIMLILVFAGVLGWFPTSGAGSLQSLVLPTVALALPYVGWLARLVRAGVLEELGADYVRTARSKGISEHTVFYSHVLRNALVPVVTAAALVLGNFLGGAVIIEVVFAWPGVGRLLVDSIAFRDYAVVQADVVLLAVAFTVLNLLVDLMYGVLDPRIRVTESVAR